MNRLSPKQHKMLIWGIVVLLVAGIGAGAWRFRGKICTAYHLGRTLLGSRAMANEGNFTNVIFIHHSTGRNLIAQGNVRPLFTKAGYDFWDHDYNRIGLTRPDGAPAGYSYNIPSDNTDPDGYADLFAQPPRPLPANALSAVMQHEVIIFKSCFPVSNISSQAELNEYKRYYLSIRDVVDQYRDHIFIALTPPPLVPESTSRENAARAREFANWLRSDEFLAGHANLYTFDFFDLLAEGDPSALDHNMLRAEYRPALKDDSHPNALANETIGPQFVEFVISAIESYRASQ